MFSIDPNSRLVSLIRHQGAALREKAPPSHDAGTARQRQQEPLISGQSMIRRIAGIASDDPQRQRKAFRIFLESTLLSELSPTLMNDPDFYAMVDTVQEQMESDTDLLQAIRTAADLLLKRAEQSRIESRKEK